MIFNQNYETKRRIIELIKLLRDKVEKIERYDPTLRDEITVIINDIQNLVYQLR